MPEMTGGEALAGQLLKEGVTDLFGLPGVQLDYATDALRRVANTIRFIVPRHEQAASYMADGYARSTGKVGVCLVVPGPGMLNAMAGLSTAYACNSPVLAIVGDIPSFSLGKGWGMLHEVNDQSAILDTVTKWRGRATAPEQIPGLVREAFRQALGGRPRPVALEIPPDILAAKADITLIDPPPGEDNRLRPDSTQVAAAAALLARAKLPLIYVGGGVLAARAGRAVQALAEKLQAPVVMGENGRGAIPDSHPLAVTSLAARALFQHADAVLVVGSRFVDGMTGGSAWPVAGIQWAWVNAEASAWAPPRHADAPVLADCRLGIEAIAAALPALSPPDRSDIVRQVRDWAAVQMDQIAPQIGWLGALHAAMPKDAILVGELTQVGYVARFALPVETEGAFMGPGYQGTLGYGFPTALGVAAGNPDRAVVSITGDGGFGWAMQELATARRYGLNTATVVFDDGQFGNVALLQKRMFGASYETDLANPHYAHLAAAFGVAHARCETPDALRDTLARHCANPAQPLLIEVPVGQMPNPWPLMRLNPPPFGAGAAPPPNPLGEPPARA
jgi:acetolactate synthase-1/2/3 large subunit